MVSIMMMNTMLVDCSVRPCDWCVRRGGIVRSLRRMTEAFDREGDEGERRRRDEMSRRRRHDEEAEEEEEKIPEPPTPPAHEMRRDKFILLPRVTVRPGTSRVTVPSVAPTPTVSLPPETSLIRHYMTKAIDVLLWYQQ